MDEAVEIVSVRATLRTPLPRRAADVRRGRGGARRRRRADGSVRAYSFTHGEWLDFAVLDRAGLGVGARVEGPAIVLEETATTYIDAELRRRACTSPARSFLTTRGGTR